MFFSTHSWCFVNDYIINDIIMFSGLKAPTSSFFEGLCFFRSAKESMFDLFGCTFGW